MKQVFNEYQLAWNGLRMDIQSRIRELDEAERVMTSYMDEYLEVERDTLEGIIQMMEGLK